MYVLSAMQILVPRTNLKSIPVGNIRAEGHKEEKDLHPLSFLLFSVSDHEKM